MMTCYCCAAEVTIELDSSIAVCGRCWADACKLAGYKGVFPVEKRDYSVVVVKQKKLIDARIQLLTKYWALLCVGADEAVVPLKNCDVLLEDAEIAVAEIGRRFENELTDNVALWSSKGICEVPPFTMLADLAKVALVYEWRKVKREVFG